MLILDRYLLRQFLQIFAYCFISLAGLYIVIDAFNKLDKFNKVTADHGNLLLVMAQWYGYQCIGFFDRTSGMLTLIAAMFTIALFQRYNELIALQAAGVRKGRIVRPIVIGSHGRTSVNAADSATTERPSTPRSSSETFSPAAQPRARSRACTPYRYSSDVGSPARLFVV